MGIGSWMLCPLTKQVNHQTTLRIYNPYDLLLLSVVLQRLLNHWIILIAIQVVTWNPNCVLLFPNGDNNLVCETTSSLISILCLCVPVVGFTCFIVIDIRCRYISFDTLLLLAEGSKTAYAVICSYVLFWRWHLSEIFEFFAEDFWRSSGCPVFSRGEKKQCPCCPYVRNICSFCTTVLFVCMYILCRIVTFCADVQVTHYLQCTKYIWKKKFRHRLCMYTFFFARTKKIFGTRPSNVCTYCLYGGTLRVCTERTGCTEIYECTLPLKNIKEQYGREIVNFSPNSTGIVLFTLWQLT